MLKKLKNKLKLILKTMTISILILMTLVNSFSLAADYIDKGSNGEFTSKEEGIVLKRVKTGEDLYYYFSPTQTGLYEVTAMGVSNSVNIANCLYRLDRVVKSQLSTSNYSYTNVSLASEKKGNEVNFANVNNDAYKLSKDNKRVQNVYVILDKDSMYAVRFKDSFPLYMIVIKKANEDPNAVYGFSNNFPSAWITMGKKDYNIQSADPQISGYYVLNVPTQKVNQLVNDMKLDDVTNQSHAFQWLENILVSITFAIGNVIVDIFEKAVGIKGLTLDGIIFNKLDFTNEESKAYSPKIDLRPLGGIGKSLGSDYEGVLVNSGVVDVVSTVFNGLKTIVFVMYIVLLLYVGLKMLMSVGTKDEPKSKKFFQYWLTGIILLIVVPYFLPAIPHISNELVKLLEGKAKSNSKYSVQEVRKELGVDFAGEDAEVIEMVREIETRIQKLQGQGVSGEISEEDLERALEKLNREIASCKTQLERNEADSDKTSAIISKMEALRDYIKDNYEVWNDSEAHENHYNSEMEEIKELAMQAFAENTRIDSRINEIIGTTGIYHGPLSNLSDDKKEYVRNKLIEYDNYLKDHYQKSDNEQKTNELISDLKNYLGSAYDNKAWVTDTQGNPINMGTTITTDLLIKNYRSAYDSRYTFFTKYVDKQMKEYKDALVLRRIEEYEEMLNSLNDPMMRLYDMAKKQSRVVYAIAWAILMFQVIAILFMYYKRVFVVLILVVLFPIVMALYVIDKMGDGKAQSLQNWFKEFLVNCLIQFLHALVYVLVVNLGIDICNIDPTRNWFFLIIAVTCLFPIEKMIRQIVGLNSSTVGGLKNNIAMLIAAGAAIRATGKNMYNLGANTASKGAALGKDIRDKHADGQSFSSIKNDLVKERMDKLKEEWKKPANDIAEKRKHKSQLRQSRSDNRAYRIQAAGDAREAIKNGVGTIGDRVDIARGAVANVTGTVSNTMNKIRSSKIGRVGANAANVAAYSKAYGGKIMKKSAGAYRKVAGTAAGIAEGMEAAADSAFANGEGFTAGITAGRNAVHGYAGFKDHKRNEKEKEVSTPSNFANSYSSRSSANSTDDTPDDALGGSIDVTDVPIADPILAGGATYAAASAVLPDDEPSTGSVEPTEVPAEEPKDNNIEIEEKVDLEREIDGEGNVLGVSGESETTGTFDLDEGSMPDISIEKNISVGSDGSVEVEADTSLNTSGSGTMTSTTNSDGSTSSESRDV